MQNHVLRELPNSVVEALKPRLRFHNFAPGQVLVAACDKINNLYFPVTGAVSLVCEVSSGCMLETAMIGNESVVGGSAALGECEVGYNAVVQIGGTGFALDVATAHSTARASEDFRQALSRSENLILAQAQQSAACSVCHNLTERMARWLLRTRDVLGSDSFVLTQESLGEMLGVRRTSVSIAAREMAEAGLISYRRGRLKINDPDALSRKACECYTTVRMRYEALKNPKPSPPTLANTPGGQRAPYRKHDQSQGPGAS